MDEKILEELEQADWNRIYRELPKYTYLKVKRLSWRNQSYENLPQGKTPLDIVQEAIAKVFNGTRQWNPDEIDLLNYLKTVVDSLVNHLVESKNHKILQRLPETENGVSLEEVLPLDASSLSSRPKTPEEILLEQEREEQVWSEIIDAADGDVELEILVDSIMEGNSKPAEMAEEKGIDVQRIYQLRRKLRRRMRARKKQDR